MKNLNLEKLHEVMNILSEKQEYLSENNVYISFLGTHSNYTAMSFESFLEYYSFKIDNDTITVFNDDSVAYEDYTTNDFSYIPAVLLSFTPERLNNWIETEIKLQLEAQEREKIAEKESIKQQIELLNKRLERL